MNWTPGNIFEARDKDLSIKGNLIVRLKLYSDGWKIGAIEKLDVWTACRILNDLEAKPI